MSDMKSKLPTVSELTSWAGKFFKDITNSVSEIAEDYKKNHSGDAEDKPEAKAEDSAPTVQQPTEEVKTEEVKTEEVKTEEVKAEGTQDEEEKQDDNDNNVTPQ